MIIRKDKSFETRSDKPNENWYENEDNYIIDETTEEGQQMAELYMNNYPLVDFEHDGEFVTKVILLDRPERPEEVEGKEIQLVQNEQGEWEYIYVDIPKTQEEIQQEVINTLGQELVTIKLQLIMGGM